MRARAQLLAAAAVVLAPLLLARPACAQSLPVTASSAAGQSCGGGSQPFASTVRLGRYVGATFAAFTTCGTYSQIGQTAINWYDAANVNSGTPAESSFCYWRLPAAPGGLLSGQTNVNGGTAVAAQCSGYQYPDCAPTLRFTADVSYTNVGYTASFCLTNSCGSSFVTATANALGSQTYAFPVPAGGAASSGCSAGAPLTYNGFVASLPAGSFIELYIGMGGGCDCISFVADLSVYSATATPSISPSVRPSPSRSHSRTPSPSLSATSSAVRGCGGGPGVAVSPASGLSNGGGAASAAACAAGCCAGSCALWVFSATAAANSQCWYSAAPVASATAFYSAAGWVGSHTNATCPFSAAAAVASPQAIGLTQVALPPGLGDAGNQAACAEACCMTAGCAMHNYCPSTSSGPTGV